MTPSLPTIYLREVREHYVVDGYSRWFVIHCRNARIARRWGVKELGRGGVFKVRPATCVDVRGYASLAGVSLPLRLEEALE